jgi:glucosamine-phosphate N-acetyltransferase
MIRKLEETDYDKNLIELLNFLYKNNNFSRIDFYSVFHYVNSNNHINIIVKEIDNKIVAIGTILIEQKLIHNLGTSGYIQDIIVHNDYRDKGYSKEIVDSLKKIALENKCYKVVLNCSDDKIKLYEKMGFKLKGNEMVIYSKL